MPSRFVATDTVLRGLPFPRRRRDIHAVTDIGKALLKLGDGELNRCENTLRDEVIRQERTIAQH